MKLSSAHAGAIRCYKLVTESHTPLRNICQRKILLRQFSDIGYKVCIKVVFVCLKTYFIPATPVRLLNISVSNDRTQPKLVH
jgi:hypothetical protein